MPTCKNCPKGKKKYWKGNEPSPKGLGYCAGCVGELGVVKKGKDGNDWITRKQGKYTVWRKHSPKKKKISPKKKPSTKKSGCPSGKMRSPSGRCMKINGPTYKKYLKQGWTLEKGSDGKNVWVKYTPQPPKSILKKPGTAKKPKRNIRMKPGTLAYTYRKKPLPRPKKRGTKKLPALPKKLSPNKKVQTVDHVTTYMPGDIQNNEIWNMTRKMFLNISPEIKIKAVVRTHEIKRSKMDRAEMDTFIKAAKKLLPANIPDKDLQIRGFYDLDDAIIPGIAEKEEEDYVDLVFLQDKWMNKLIEYHVVFEDEKPQSPVLVFMIGYEIQKQQGGGRRKKKGGRYYPYY